MITLSETIESLRECCDLLDEWSERGVFTPSGLDMPAARCAGKWRQIIAQYDAENEPWWVHGTDRAYWMKTARDMKRAGLDYRERVVWARNANRRMLYLKREVKRRHG